MAKTESLILNSKRIQLSKISTLDVKWNKILNDFKSAIAIKRGLSPLVGLAWPTALNGREELQVIEYRSSLLDKMKFFNVSLRDESEIPVDGPSNVLLASTFVRYNNELYSLSSRNASQQASDGMTVELTNYALAKKGDTFESFSQMHQLVPQFIEELIKRSDKRRTLQEIATLCLYFAQ